ncbi:unnamed protein product, partial [Brachionus calyciflorus]
MMKILVLINLFVFLIDLVQLDECNVKYEYERMCSCKTRYSHYGLIGQEIFPPSSNYTYCDNDDLSYRACYKENCVDRCEKSIRELNKIDKLNNITQAAGNDVCKWLGNKSITETGIVLLSESNPGVCNAETREITSRICCNMRCKCLVQLNGINLVDLTSQLPKKEPFYDCKIFEFDECESDCRKEASKYFENNTVLLDRRKNTLDHIERNSKFCKLVNRPVNSPGENPSLLITTAPGDLSLGKQINLGKLCCSRPCKCQFIDSNEKMIFDLSNLLNNKKDEYYSCSDQFKECKRECLNKMDEFLTKKTSTLNNPDETLNIFETDLVDSSGSNQLCNKLNSTINRPGASILLKIESDQNEVLNIGKLCCKRQCQCQLIGKNFGNRIDNFQNVAFDSKLIKDLSSFMPIRNLSYDCSKESENCLRDCKIAAGTYLNSNKLKTSENTIQSLDIFFEFKAATKMCEAFNKKIESPGVDVYLRYDIKSMINDYQNKDDLFIGRICCNDFLLPANKCKFHVLPDIQ